MKDLRVLVIDDEMLIARDLQRILKRLELTNIGIANNSEEVLELYPTFKPHLVLCDINLEEPKDGISLAAEILENLNTQIIFITAHSDENYLARAGELNPLSYILKPFNKDQVMATVKVALANKEVMEGGTVKQNYRELLTATELKILRLIADGGTTAGIADQLFVSKKTVENHRANISRKLDLEKKNNALLTWAMDHKYEL